MRQQQLPVEAGWRVAALEAPVIADGGTVVCDVVLFNADTGHLLVVEAKSGANIEPEQGIKLGAIAAERLIVACGITVPQAVPLRRCGPGRADRGDGTASLPPDRTGAD